MSGRIKAESIRQHGTVLRELDKSGNETIYGTLAALGGLQLNVTTLTTAGANVIDSTDNIVLLNNASGKITATIAAPTAGQVLIIWQIDAGTQAHTVTLTAGTWNGTNTVATLNAAGESLVVVGISATRYLVLVNNGSVAFS